MEHFPVLVEHGPLIWRGIQILFVVLVLFAIWSIRRMIARGTLRAAMRRVRANHGAILGTLRGGSASTVDIDAPPSLTTAGGVASWRSESLWLDTPERSIELVGPITVVAGSTYQARRGRLPALVAEVREAVTSAHAWSSKSVHSALALHVAAGDEVEVRGVLESRAGQNETMPRDADIAWTLRGDDQPLRLAATRPAIPQLPLGIVRSAIVAALAFGASNMMLKSCRAGWERECKGSETADGNTPIELGNGHACVLLASTPSDREWGKRALYDYLEEHPYRDDVAAARLDALAHEIKDCDERVQRLLRNRRYELALDEARACGDRRAEEEALTALGMFEEAATIEVPAAEHQPALPTVTTLVATGRWMQAAAAMRARPAAQPAEREYQNCIADWFAHLGGDREALPRLRTTAENPESWCNQVLSDVDEEKPRHRFSPRLRNPEELLLRPEWSSYDAIELWIPMPETELKSNRADRLRVRAVKQVLDNDTAGALATARDVAVLVKQIRAENSDDDFEFSLRAPDMLTHAIEIYTPSLIDNLAAEFAANAKRSFEREARITGEPIRVITGIEDYDLMRYGRLFARSTEPLGEAQAKRLDELTRAGRTDPQRVMAIIQKRRYAHWYPLDLLVVVPHLPELRTQLARELPHSVPNSYWTGPPVARALDAFAFRELLESVGAIEEAAHWDAIYRRHDKMLSDPVKARALRLVR